MNRFDISLGVFLLFDDVWCWKCCSDHICLYWIQGLSRQMNRKKSTYILNCKYYFEFENGIWKLIDCNFYSLNKNIANFKLHFPFLSKLNTAKMQKSLNFVMLPKTPWSSSGCHFQMKRPTDLWSMFHLACLIFYWITQRHTYLRGYLAFHFVKGSVSAPLSAVLYTPLFPLGPSNHPCHINGKFCNPWLTIICLIIASATCECITLHWRLNWHSWPVAQLMAQFPLRVFVSHSHWYLIHLWHLWAVRRPP